MTVQVITFGDGRLNPLGSSTRRRLLDDLKAAERDPTVTSVVITGRGSNFSAGADMSEFDSDSSAAVATNDDRHSDTTGTTGSPTLLSLVDVVTYVECFPKPVVASIQGVALGGGLELALACHYRIAAASASMGLPEVTVGVIPGAGGTQRLPRLVGVTTALDMILTGKPVTAKRALEIGLVDAVSNEQESAIAMQANAIASKWADWAQLMPLDDRRLLRRPLRETPAELSAIVTAARHKLPPRNRGGESVHCALEAVEACGDDRSSGSGSGDGMQRESQLFHRALAQGHGRRHAFFAVRAAQKNSPLTTTAPPSSSHAPLLQPKDAHVGVVGAGTMGSGIALVLLQAGFTVHLVDIQHDALQKGVALVQKTLQSMALKGSLSESKASLLLSRLVPSQSLQDLKECDLVVEAVVENLVIKKKLFTTLGQVTPPTCLLLSNTSTLDVDQMASVLSPKRQKMCAGWHFFSPAHVMKLVEIVVARETSPETVALLQSLTKKIGKIGVTVGNCDGFVGNRMLNPYTSECVLLLAEGDATVESVDEAIRDFGMALGPFGMSDLAGNDIG
jgi:3-hydroxyacyl-CoA dehydrogenase/enoyl-CoA hydratase/carnithine racemase